MLLYTVKTGVNWGLLRIYSRLGKHTDVFGLLRQPGDTAQANRDNDQDLAKRRREKEGHGG